MMKKTCGKLEMLKKMKESKMMTRKQLDCEIALLRLQIATASLSSLLMTLSLMSVLLVDSGRAFGFVSSAVLSLSAQGSAAASELPSEDSQTVT